MTTKRYDTPVRLPKLTEELAAAFPAWTTTNAAGERTAHYSVEGDATFVQITWPEATPVAEVDAVVAAHDPTRPPTPTLDERLAAKAALAQERQIASPP
jgi:hypothetical protein